jgi:hypothetical protein
MQALTQVGRPAAPMQRLGTVVAAHHQKSHLQCANRRYAYIHTYTSYIYIYISVQNTPQRQRQPNHDELPRQGPCQLCTYSIPAALERAHWLYIGVGGTEENKWETSVKQLSEPRKKNHT